MTEQKGKIRKEMNEYDNEMGACFTEALLNYETVTLCVFLSRIVSASTDLSQKINSEGPDCMNQNLRGG